MSKKKTVLLTAAVARKKNELTIELSDGEHHVLARRDDMTMTVLEGRLPMPLLAAVQKMVDMPGATDVERLESLGETHGQELANLLKEHAVRVVIQPKLSLEDEGPGDSRLHVDYLGMVDLMKIWQETAVVPAVTNQQAATFRGAADVPADSAASDGTDLRPAPESVDLGEREVVTG